MLDKIVNIVRKIIGYFIIFVSIIGFSTYIGKRENDDLFFAIFFLILGIFILPKNTFIKEKIFNFSNKKEKLNTNKNISLNNISNNNDLKNIENKIDKVIKINYDLEHNFPSYTSFNCITGEVFNVGKEEKNYNYFGENQFWEKVIEAYREITIKFENIKLNESLESIKNFENDTHIFFNERVLKVALDNGYIDKMDSDGEKPEFPEGYYHDYFGRILSKKEYEEAINIFKEYKIYWKKLLKYNIYDLYSKTLRRIGNSYKKYKEWELALKIFETIKYFGFEGIRDGQSIAKCKKEIELKNKKLLK